MLLIMPLELLVLNWVSKKLGDDNDTGDKDVEGEYTEGDVKPVLELDVLKAQEVNELDASLELMLGYSVGVQ